MASLPPGMGHVGGVIKMVEAYKASRAGPAPSVPAHYYSVRLSAPRHHQEAPPGPPPPATDDYTQQQPHATRRAGSKRQSMEQIEDVGNINSMREASGYSSNISSRRASRRDMTVDEEEIAAKFGAVTQPRGSAAERWRREKLCSYVLRDIIGADLVFTGPFGDTPVTYLDYVASGRPLRCIEDYLKNEVLPCYANTHTEVSFTAQQTQLFREEARHIIKESCGGGPGDCAVFCGSGSTAAVNQLVHILQPRQPIVLVGPYEHHSNILAWKNIPGSKVIRIRSTEEGLLDMDHIAWELQTLASSIGKKRDIIGTFSAGSNVTGILTDVNAVSALVHRHGGLVFWDYACVAPYVDINMNSEGRDEQRGLAYKDAVFISIHKFIGGPGTPGLLIAKKSLFRNDVPHITGGGTVQFVMRDGRATYRLQPEEREEGGTPAIIEAIRAGLVFKLKNAFSSAFIMSKEEEMFRRAVTAWARVPGLVVLGNLRAARLPIFPMVFYHARSGRFLHHDFVAMVMNDVFGLQVRSGCACAGPYGMDLLGVCDEKAREFEDISAEHHYQDLP